VQVAEVARNPGFGWRYKIRGGENDTHMTTWMVTLLRLAEMGGVAVDRNAYAGARLWLDKMTDPNFGWVGYNFPGGVAARPQGRNDLFPPENTQSMTAAGIWCSHLLGGEMLTHVICRRGIELCEEVPPERDRKHRDQYYFQFGALAMFHADSGKWPAWESALEETYLALQEEDGSWPADGVWGSYGGSVYSTSMAVLALLTPYRYPRGFASSPELQPSVRDAVEALEKAAKDDDATVAAAAELALRRITRE
jgi:hypothetical protein